MYFVSDGNGRFVRNIIGGGYKPQKWSWTTNLLWAEMLSEEAALQMQADYGLTMHKIVAQPSECGERCVVGIVVDND